MGLNPLPCPVNVSVAAWPWGTYLGDEGIANGVSVQDQLVAAPRPQRGADGGQGHGDVRELVAGQGRGDQGRLRRGHPARPRRPGQRVHRREHLHRARRRHPDPAHLRRRAPSTASPRTPSRPSPPTSATRCATSSIIRTDLYLADEAFLTGTAAEVVPIRAVDDRPVGHGPPGADHQGDPADLLRHRARRGGPVQGLAGPCRLTRPTSTPTGTPPHPRSRPQRPRARLRPARPARGGRHLRHDPARRQPAGGPLAHRRRQACGWPSSSTTSGSPTSRAAGPGPTPRTTSSSPGPRRS